MPDLPDARGVKVFPACKIAIKGSIESTSAWRVSERHVGLEADRHHRLRSRREVGLLGSHPSFVSIVSCGLAKL